MSKRSFKKQLSTGKIIGLCLLVGMMIGGIWAILQNNKGDSVSVTQTQSQCEHHDSLAQLTDQFATGQIAALLPIKPAHMFDDLAYVDENGKNITLSELKGRLILLNLWATWCAPCREEMPYLDELQAKFGDESFEVVTLNIDAKETDKARKFFDEIEIKHLELYKDITGEVFRRLQKSARIRGLPTTYLIGPGGCEVARMSGPAHWASGDAVNFIEKVKGLLGPQS